MREKSCGTVLYTLVDGTVHYVLISGRDGAACGFPKGHVEKGETERETALRETWEETSVNARIIGNFKRRISYRLRKGNIKTVIYFIAYYEGQTPKSNPGFENHKVFLSTYENAMELLSYDNTKEILKDADSYIRSYINNSKK